MNNNSTSNQASERTWKCALYLRLSKEDGDKAESDSIVGQKTLIHEHLKSRPELQICSTRVDDGYSGVNFNRPDFIAMMEDIKAGRIDCVIVKDLSRFGRNWVETGKYIEQLFPHIGVRFIAINDHVDSIQARTSSDNIIIPFKNITNDAYSRDISIKTKSQLDIKRKKGDFIGSFAVYGYMKDSANHNKLVIDEPAAFVVRDIFRWRIDGMSCQGIANRLNDMGVLSPYEYKRELGLRFSTAFKLKSKAIWSAVAVSRILKNEVYLGTLEQGKKTSKSYKIKVRIEKPKEDWIRVENSHEPIVSIDDFKLVAQLLKQDVRVAPTEETVYLFSGLLKCADCKQNMVRKLVPSGNKKYAYYVCSTNKQAKNECSVHNTSETQLEQAVFESINHHIINIVNVEGILQFIETLPLKQLDVQKFDKQIQAKKVEMNKYQLRKVKLHEDYQDGIIDKNELAQMKTAFTSRYNEAEQALFKLTNELEDILANRTDKHFWIEHFKQYQNIDALNRKMLVNLVDTIHVYENNRIHIKFRYQYHFDKAVSFIETVGEIADISTNNCIKEAM